jgi:hypothetical protein
MIVKKDANAPANEKGKDRFVLNKAESDSDAEGHLMEPYVEQHLRQVLEVFLHQVP